MKFLSPFAVILALGPGLLAAPASDPPPAAEPPAAVSPAPPEDPPPAPSAGRNPHSTSADMERAIREARDRVFKTIVRVDAVEEEFVEGEKKLSGGQGSGTVIDEEGRVLTNYHVAGKAKEIRCTLYNKEIVRARLVGSDPWTDLAVLVLDPEERKEKCPVLHHAELGDSDALEVGDFVSAMGTPFGLSRTATFGRVSNTERYLGDELTLQNGIETGFFNNWIQTDAPIYPGNSGGPLVNIRGQVVGVNSRVISESDLGFAVPINVAREVIAAILRDGAVRRGYLGLRFQKVQDLEGFLGLGKNEGVLVPFVEEGSPAQAAGAKAGDLLLTYNGRPVSARFDEEIPAINKMIGGTKIGATASLLLLRHGKRLTLEVPVTELGKSQGDDREFKEWGLTLRVFTDRMAIRMGFKEAKGVVVNGVKDLGPADQAGLVPDEDVIFEADGERVDTMEDFDRIFRRAVAEKKEKVLLKVRRGVRGVGVNYALIKAPKEKAK